MSGSATKRWCEASRRRSIPLWAALSCILVGLNWPGPVSGAEGTLEYKVKATFLFNFAKFVTWPAAAVPAGAPLVVGVVGQDPFGGVLDQVLAGQSVSGHAFEIRRFPTVERAAGSHIIFLCRSEKERSAAALAALRGRPVLLVSETDAFCEQGGQVNFVVIEGKVKIEINPDECERAGLKVSSKLLSVARIVRTQPKN